VPPRPRHLGRGASPLLLVEHVPRPGWQSGGALGGKAAGERDVYHAQRLAYPKGAHLAFDLEGLGDQGVPVGRHCGCARRVAGDDSPNATPRDCARVRDRRQLCEIARESVGVGRKALDAVRVIPASVIRGWV
jgi:hypothetical protein